MPLKPAPSVLEMAAAGAGMGISTIYVRFAKGWGPYLWHKTQRNAPSATEAGAGPAGMGMIMMSVRSAKAQAGHMSMNLIPQIHRPAQLPIGEDNQKWQAGGKLFPPACHF
jgi:hypothetical protein